MALYHAAMYVRLFATAFPGQGEVATRLIRESGLRAEQLDDPFHRVPVESYRALFERVVRARGDEWHGLGIACETARYANLGLPGYLLASSVTLGDALGWLSRFANSVSNLQSGRLEQHGTATWLIGTVSDEANPFLVRQMAFMGLSTLTLLRDLSGQPSLPLEIHFKHARPPSADCYESHLHTRVRWAQPHYALVVPDSALKSPCMMSEANLARILEGVTKERLAQADAGQETSRAVLRSLGVAMQGGYAGQRATARSLGLTPRTLRNRLAAEGLTYDALLRHVRVDHARAYLRAGRSAEEISELLGYRETRSFVRAFAAWTGETPGRYRRQFDALVARVAAA